MNYTPEHSISSTSLLCEHSHTRSGRMLTEEAFAVSEVVEGFSQVHSRGIGECAENLVLDNIGRGLSGGSGRQRQAEPSVPPHSDTRVLDALASGNTQAQTAVEVIPDWVAVTFQKDVLEVLALFGAHDWMPIQHGWKFYKQGFVRGDVKVWYDGNEDQGVNVQASGQGCRQLEAESVVKDWVDFISCLLEAGGEFSRLDIAMDDRAPSADQGRIRREAVEECISSGRVVSRYTVVRDNGSRSLTDGSVKGWTRTFGAGKSETCIRVYDKAMQAGTEAFHWMRVELQTRREKAQQLAQVIVQRGLPGVAAVVRGLLEFKEQGTHSQRERWVTADWWSAFLGEVEKVRLTVRPLVRTMQQVKTWFLRNVAPLLAVVVADAQGDLDFIADCCREGEKRWKQRHRALLSRSEGLCSRTPYQTEMLSSALLGVST